MARRVVEEVVRSGRLRRRRRVRIDLHGVSTFGPGKHHTLIRWEWITEITASPHGVIVAATHEQVVFPSGVFSIEAETLADRLAEARSIFKRGDIIEELGRA